MAYLSTAGLGLLDRRGFLGRLGGGLAAVALGDLLGADGLLAADAAADDPQGPRPPHFEAKARRVVQIFCTGAVSHLDTWDYKPELIRRDGRAAPGGKIVTFQGENGALARSPWAFRPRGASGKMLSDLLPNLAERADDLCFVHSLTTKTNTHGPGEMAMSTGFTVEGFPSAGAWTAYALGTEDRDLPSFVAIPDPRGVPQQGPANWSNGFLPAAFQGSAFNADRPIRHLERPAGLDPATDRATRDYLRFLNDEHLAKSPGDTDLAGRIAAYELAARLQLAAPEVADLAGESPATRALYGVDHPDPVRAGFARNCLLARRLLERGVRYVTLYNGAFAMGEGNLNWDAHRRLKSDYERHGPILDGPAAALLVDLKARGLLADTLVLWTTEFGRMPTFQKGAEGRDHNPDGFTAWMAGAGVKAPYSHGATDELGHRAVEDRADVHDLHATVLHLLGLDHRRLTFEHNGARRRLTDVHGHVLEPILA